MPEPVAQSNYIRWDDPKVESGAGPEEDKVINEIARQINTAQAGVADRTHHAFSGTHVKVRDRVVWDLKSFKGPADREPPPRNPQTHGIVKGELEVSRSNMRAVTKMLTSLCRPRPLQILPNLPAHLAQSMFANPSKHPVALRFSSEPTDMVPDNVPQPRGLGLKIFNVEGRKLRPDGQDPKTQDIEFNSSPILELGNAVTCRDIVSEGPPPKSRE